jgi:gas vesicle protein
LLETGIRFNGIIFSTNQFAYSRRRPSMASAKVKKKAADIPQEHLDDFQSRLDSILEAMAPSSGLFQNPDTFDAEMDQLKTDLEELLTDQEQVLGNAEDDMADLIQERIDQLEGAIGHLSNIIVEREEDEEDEEFIERVREEVWDAVSGLA